LTAGVGGPNPLASTPRPTRKAGSGSSPPTRRTSGRTSIPTVRARSSREGSRDEPRAREVKEFFERLASERGTMSLAYYDGRVIDKMATVPGPNIGMTVADGVAPQDGNRASMSSPMVDFNDAVDGQLVSSVLGLGDLVGTIGATPSRLTSCSSACRDGKRGSYGYQSPPLRRGLSTFLCPFTQPSREASREIRMRGL
jgi:hypothetical protein